MKLLVTFLLAVGLCAANALPAKRAVPVGDDYDDIVKMMTEILKDAIDQSAKDVAQFVQWIEQEAAKLEPELEKAEETLAAVGKQVLADIVEFNRDVLKQVLRFAGSHAKVFQNMYALVKDAMAKIDSGDSAGVTKDIEAIVADLLPMLDDIADQIEANAKAFVQWLGAKWEQLKPLLDQALEALETLAHDFSGDLAAEFQTLMKNVAAFLDAHKQQFTEIWHDVLDILKTFGIPVHDVTDLTTAINDAEQMAKILQNLAQEFQPIAQQDAQDFLKWVQAEYQKIQPTIQKDLAALKAFVDDLLAEANKVIKEDVADLTQFIKAHEKDINSIVTDVVNGIHALEKGDADAAMKDFQSAQTKAEALCKLYLPTFEEHLAEFVAWAKNEWTTKVKPQLDELVKQLKQLAADLFDRLQTDSIKFGQQLEDFLSKHQDEVDQLNALGKKFLQDLGLVPA